MSLKEKIIDYNAYKNKVDYWIDLKGEKKYCEFIKILEKNGIAVEWERIDDLFRYDKRLLINCFKYLSFYEEFLRAQIWNISLTSYNKLAKKYLKGVIDEVIKNENRVRYKDFNIRSLKKNQKEINFLRNQVCHNEIILNIVYGNKDVKKILIDFKDCLPIPYQDGFCKNINDCCKGLKLSKKIIIKL